MWVLPVPQYFLYVSGRTQSTSTPSCRATSSAKSPAPETTCADTTRYYAIFNDIKAGSGFMAIVIAFTIVKSTILL